MTFLKLSSCFALKGVKGKSDKGKNAFFPIKARRILCRLASAAPLAAISIWCASAATEEEPLTPFEAALRSNDMEAYRKAMLDQFLFWKQQLGVKDYDCPPWSSTDRECPICYSQPKQRGFSSTHANAKHKCSHYYCMGCIARMVRENHGCLYCPHCKLDTKSPVPVTKGTILGFALDPTFYAQYCGKDSESIYQNYELAYHLWRKQEPPEQSTIMKPRLKRLSSVEIRDIRIYAGHKWKEEVENRRNRSDPETLARQQAEEKASMAAIDQHYREGKQCPKCESPAIHYRGHACHHITCPNLARDGNICGYEYCYVCLGPFNKCGCPWQGPTFCNTEGAPNPYDGRMRDCRCPECPDCRLSKIVGRDGKERVLVEPCDGCDGSHRAADGGPGGTSCSVCQKDYRYQRGVHRPRRNGHCC